MFVVCEVSSTDDESRGECRVHWLMNFLSPSFPSTIVSSLRCRPSAARSKVWFEGALPLPLLSFLTPKTMASSHRNRSSSDSSGAMVAGGGDGRSYVGSGGKVDAVAPGDALDGGGEDRPDIMPDMRDVGGGDDGGDDDEESTRSRFVSPRNTLPMLAMG